MLFLKKIKGNNNINLCILLNVSTIPLYAHIAVLVPTYPILFLTIAVGALYIVFNIWNSIISAYILNIYSLNSTCVAPQDTGVEYVPNNRSRMVALISVMEFPVLLGTYLLTLVLSICLSNTLWYTWSLILLILVQTLNTITRYSVVLDSVKIG